MDGNNQVAGKVGGFVKVGGVGGSFKDSIRKTSPKYHACMAKNVVGAWAASPNFKRPLSSSPFETTSILREAMKP